MSTVVAAAPMPSLHSSVERTSPRQFMSIAPATRHSPASATEPPAKRARSNGGSPESASREDVGKSSPSGLRNAVPPMITVKQEPGSPALAPARPRPKRLDLSSSMAANRGPQTARPSAPLTAQSAGLHLHDVGLACLSPGFATHDPALREQLQRSMDVRDKQRQIIEARQKGGKPDSSGEYDGSRTQDTTLFGVQTDARTPASSRRKGPPPGLSIAAPAAAQFSQDRVIQSAPLHHTFTGLRSGEYPSSRHAQHGPSGLSQTSHIHHVPATQTANRLPPISDVFAKDRFEGTRQHNHSPGPSSHSNGQPSLSSPSCPPQQPQQHQQPPPPPPQQQQRQPSQHPPFSARERFRSAEEAVHGLSGGRDELMPKVVHYGGVQPPTPPSPMPGSGKRVAPGAKHHALHDHASRPDLLARTQSMNGRRRGRDEYEADYGSPPVAYHRSEPKRATLASRGRPEEEGDWKVTMSSAEKRAEFIRLCEQAWDLFHS